MWGGTLDGVGLVYYKLVTTQVKSKEIEASLSETVTTTQ